MVRCVLLCSSLGADGGDEQTQKEKKVEKEEEKKKKEKKKKKKKKKKEDLAEGDGTEKEEEVGEETKVEKKKKEEQAEGDGTEKEEEEEVEEKDRVIFVHYDQRKVMVSQLHPLESPAPPDSEETSELRQVSTPWFKRLYTVL